MMQQRRRLISALAAVATLALASGSARGDALSDIRAKIEDLSLREVTIERDLEVLKALSVDMESGDFVFFSWFSGYHLTVVPKAFLAQFIAQKVAEGVLSAEGAQRVAAQAGRETAKLRTVVSQQIAEAEVSLEKTKDDLSALLDERDRLRDQGGQRPSPGSESLSGPQEGVNLLWTGSCEKEIGNGCPPEKVTISRDGSGTAVYTCVDDRDEKSWGNCRPHDFEGGHHGAKCDLDRHYTNSSTGGYLSGGYLTTHGAALIEMWRQESTMFVRVYFDGQTKVSSKPADAYGNFLEHFSTGCDIKE